MALKNITKERLIECLQQDSNQLRSQDDGAARLIKGFRLAAEKEPLQRRQEFEAWLIQFFGIPGSPTLNSNELKGVFKVFGVHDNLQKDLELWWELIQDIEVEKDHWVQVLLGLRSSASLEWRRFRMEFVVALLRASSGLPEALRIGESFSTILSLDIGRFQGDSALEQLNPRSGSRLWLVYSSLIKMVEGPCDSEWLKVAAQKHFSPAVREAQHVTQSLHGDFHRWFTKNMPVHSLALISSEEFERLRWVFERRPQLFECLNYSDVDKKIGREVYEALFREFTVPHILKCRFFEGKLGDKELSYFEHVLLGRNLRDSKVLPFEMTNREIYAFTVFEDYGPLSVLESLMFIALRLRTSDDAFAAAFLHRGERENLQAWLKILVKLHSLGLRKEHLQNTMDYIRAVHFGGVRDLLRARLGLSSFLRSVEDWHQDMVAASFRGLNIVLPSANVKEVIFQYQGRTFKFRQLRTSFELHEEGNALQHCVYSYVSYCYSGDCFIFSMTERGPHSWEKLITLEVRTQNLVQVRGIRNRAADSIEQHAIEMWTSKVGYHIQWGVFSTP